MNTRFFVFLLIGIGITMGANAQQKELTLKDAVLGQWRQFYPKQLANLQWRAETDMVTYRSDDGTKMMQRSAKGASASTLFDLAALNKALEQKLDYIPSIRWESKDVFRITYQGAILLLQVTGAELSVKTTLTPPAEVEHLETHLNSGQVAYTRANNVYLQTKNGQEVAVTNNEDPNIVSGQAIARQEFGITKGLFWSPNGEALAFYQKDESKVGDYPLLDISSTPGKLRTIKYPMAGQASESAKIGLYNTQTKKTTYLFVSGAEDQYLTNLAWGPAGKFVYVAIVNRDQNHVYRRVGKNLVGRRKRALCRA